MTLLAFLALWVALARGVWWLFSQGDDAFTPDFKRRVGRWLARVDPQQITTSWPSTWARLFDAVFGQRHFSLRCLIRSCVASLAAVVLLSVILFGLIGTTDAFALRGLVRSNLYVTTWMLVTVIFANVLGDYVSLLETRTVIGWMERSSALRITGLLLLDVGATAAIWSVGYILAYVTIVWMLNFFEGGSLALSPYISHALENLLLVLRSVIPLDVERNERVAAQVVLFWSTFLTSLWAWLYATSVVLVRVTHSSRVWMTFGSLVRVLNVQERPFHALGFMAAAIAAFVYPLVWLVLS